MALLNRKCVYRHLFMVPAEAESSTREIHRLSIQSDMAREME